MIIFEMTITVIAALDKFIQKLSTGGFFQDRRRAYVTSCVDVGVGSYRHFFRRIVVVGVEYVGVGDVVSAPFWSKCFFLIEFCSENINSFTPIINLKIAVAVRSQSNRPYNVSLVTYRIVYIYPNLHDFFLRPGHFSE